MSIVEELFKHKMVDVPMRAMHWAISERDIDFVKQLWDLCDGKFSDESPCECGCCVKPDYFNNFGDLALKRGDLAMAEFFNSKNAMFSKCATAYAASSGNLDLVKWAVECLEEPHIIETDDGCKTFCHNLGWALVCGAKKSLEIVKYLETKIREHGHMLLSDHRYEAIQAAMASEHDDIVAFLTP